MNTPNLYKSGPLENKSNSCSPITNNIYCTVCWNNNTNLNSTDSPRMTTLTDITKQNTSLIASAIKFTDAGRKSYLFSVGKKKKRVGTIFKIHIVKYGIMVRNHISSYCGGLILRYLHWLRILVIGCDWFPRWQNPDPEPKCRLKISSTVASKDSSNDIKKRKRMRTGPSWTTWAEDAHRRTNRITEKTSDNHTKHNTEAPMKKHTL